MLGRMTSIGLLAFAFAATAVASDIDKKIVALAGVVPDRSFVLMDVPDAHDFIANKMLIVSLNAGSSSDAAQQIVGQLLQPSSKPFAVLGRNDAVAAATLRRALRELKGKGGAVGEVAFIGDKKFQRDLSKIAAEANVTLIYAAYP
ncbi:hypothetical protein [Dyella mobilis]|uniref:Uncharacterized protein n=1 Tax=Dyella mobilis TaxID=1849582 RepID=A0ABS2KE65_9GAMM|nr:hypothetical protein [Dyella mobilis]MBM7129350.1 hypothetical protein [Dyella mobilis]GLQ98644.1 hypothetical protein GCM10007863_30640 [Dyella mobilis]